MDIVGISKTEQVQSFYSYFHLAKTYFLSERA